MKFPIWFPRFFSNGRHFGSRFTPTDVPSWRWRNTTFMAILTCGFGYFGLGCIGGVIGLDRVGLESVIGVGSQAVAQEATLDAILDDAPVDADADVDAEEPASEPVWIDYFAQFEAMYADQLEHPEQNGFRDVLIAIGPMALEQRPLMQRVAWEDLPTNELSRTWWNENWLVICDKLHIDPYQRPPFLGYRELSDFVRFEGITGEEPPLDEDDLDYIADTDILHPDQQARLSRDVASDYQMRLANEPWTVAENPQAARWLEETSPVLDMWTKAVRKPVYTSYYPPAPLIAILLPDIQSQRSLARATQIRCQQRIASGEIDAAIEDILTLFYLGRHAQQPNILITRLVGIAIEMMGEQTIRSFVRHGNPSAEQLAALRSQLENLPATPPLDHNLQGEMLMALDTMQRLCGACSEYPKAPQSDETITQEFWSALGQNFDKDQTFLRVLNLDWNVMRPRVEACYAEMCEIARISDRTQRNEAQEAFERRWEQIHDKQFSFTIILKAMLPRTKRTEQVTDICLSAFIPSLKSFYTAVDRTQAWSDLTRIGLSVEQYHAIHGVYPATLDVLVSDGLLAELPIDPFSGRGYIYRPTPFTPPTVLGKNPSEWSWQSFRGFRATPYLLYGTGDNGLDDTAKWLQNGVKELDTQTLQQNDDLQF